MATFMSLIAFNDYLTKRGGVGHGRQCTFTGRGAFRVIASCHANSETRAGFEVGNILRQMEWASLVNISSLPTARSSREVHPRN